MTFFLPLGTAGEHLVCADLIMRGLWAGLSSAGLPYDVIADMDGRLFRVQVRATQTVLPRPGRPDSRKCYQFGLIGVSHSDIVAVVALDIRAIGYLAAKTCPSTLHLDGPDAEPYPHDKGPKTGHRTFSDFTLEAALEGIG
jgi:hypothetical protein